MKAYRLDKGASAVDGVDPRGRTEQIRAGKVYGWFFDAGQPYFQPQIEVLVDGMVVANVKADEFRGDLLRNGIGTGSHGFSAAIPHHYFDDRKHDVTARLAGTTTLLSEPLLDIVLSRADLLAIWGAVTSVEHGRVFGFCFDASDPARVLSVSIHCNGVLRRTIPADRVSTGQHGPGGHGFEFDLAEVLDTDAITDDVRLTVTRTGQPIDGLGPNLGAASVSVEIDGVTREAITGRVSVPGRSDSRRLIDIHLDGELVAILGQHHRVGSLSVFPFVVHLKEGERRREVSLSAHVAGSGQPLGTGPVTVRLHYEGSLLTNPSFAEWRDGVPMGWELPDLPGRRVQAGPPPLVPTRPEEAAFGGGSVIVHLAGDASEPTILSQSLRLDDLAFDARRLDLVTCLRTSHPCEVEAEIEVTDVDGVSHRISARISVWTQWMQRAARLELPRPMGDLAPQGRFSLRIVGPSAPDHLKIALLALGPPGFSPQRPAPLEVPEAEEAGPAANAISNGDLEGWSGVLRRRVTSRYIDCGGVCALVAKAPSRDLEVGLESVAVRDPLVGIEPVAAYGIALRGPISSGYVRLEFRLDPLQLRIARARELRFFATTSRRDARIARVFLLDRRTDENAENGVTDATIGTVARAVPISSGGRMHAYPISEALAERLSDVAAASLQDPLRTLAVVFEFEGVADCTLARLWLGDNPRTATSEDADVFMLEDGRIVAQIGRLKMIDRWRDPAPIRASERRSPALPVADPQWRRPPGYPSVDVVVCVHDALDEVLACLASIVRETTVPYTLIVVDDGSGPATRAALAAFAAGRPWVRIITNGENLGYTRSANIGLSQATAEWVVLLNSDTVVTPGWLDGMVECAASDPAIAFVGPLSNAASWQSVPDIRDPNGDWMVNVLPPTMTPADVAATIREISPRAFPRVRLLNGFCMMMRRDVLEELGFLDEVAFPAGYGEETDLCIRAEAAGYAMAIADQVYVHHAKSASFGNARRRALSKEGSRALARKHPDVDLAVRQRELAEAPSLAIIRGALRARFAAWREEPELLRPAPAPAASGVAIEVEASR